MYVFPLLKISYGVLTLNFVFDINVYSVVRFYLILFLNIDFAIIELCNHLYIVFANTIILSYCTPAIDKAMFISHFNADGTLLSKIESTV